MSDTTTTPTQSSERVEAKEHLGRLTSMADPDATWDLSSNDQAAIAWAVSAHRALLGACEAALAAIEGTEQAALHEVGHVAEAVAFLRAAITLAREGR